MSLPKAVRTWRKSAICERKHTPPHLFSGAECLTHVGVSQTVKDRSDPTLDLRQHNGRKVCVRVITWMQLCITL